MAGDCQKLVVESYQNSGCLLHSGEVLKVSRLPAVKQNLNLIKAKKLKPLQSGLLPPVAYSCFKLQNGRPTPDTRRMINHKSQNVHSN
jgi:hypothetical protein